MNGKRQKTQPGLALQPRDWGEPSVGGSQGVEPSMAKSTLESPAPTDRMSPSTLNPVEPPWYGPVCPVVWEGRHREVPPYPDQSPLCRARHKGESLPSSQSRTHLGGVGEGGRHVRTLAHPVPRVEDPGRGQLMSRDFRRTDQSATGCRKVIWRVSWSILWSSST